jgi:hypothetical protein
MEAFRLKAAVNTAAAGRLTMFLAGLLGNKREFRDEGELITTIVKVAYWRGKIYMLDYRHESNDK